MDGNYSDDGRKIICVLYKSIGISFGTWLVPGTVPEPEFSYSLRSSDSSVRGSPDVHSMNFFCFAMYTTKNRNIHVHDIVICELLLNFKQVSNILTICGQVVEKYKLVLLTITREPRTGPTIWPYYSKRREYLSRWSAVRGSLTEWGSFIFASILSPKICRVQIYFFYSKIRKFPKLFSTIWLPFGNSWFHDTNIFKNIHQINKFTPPWIA